MRWTRLRGVAPSRLVCKKYWRATMSLLCARAAALSWKETRNAGMPRFVRSALMRHTSAVVAFASVAAVGIAVVFEHAGSVVGADAGAVVATKAAPSATAPAAAAASERDIRRVPIPAATIPRGTAACVRSPPAPGLCSRSMPDTASSDRIADLLAGLNPPQRDAVTHGEGPLLILAGAGTGKTRVLTHRIAFLEHTGMARANEILAITFTNKAAQEMRERVEVLLGRRTRAMWVMTFHAACARMLRAEAEKLGYTRQFTIYDSADSRRLVKRALDELGVDTKRYTPGAVHHQISDAKNKLRDSEAYGQMVGSYFEQTVADAYRIYEREMHRMNAMDFDDLLVNAVNVLQLFQEVRDRYSTAFRHVLVDEYQDTNAVQYRWLQLLSSEHRNLAVVGDDAQCLVAGTVVTLADGTTRAIEDVSEGDEVLSCYGSGDFRPSRVTAVFASHKRREGVAITLTSGRRIISTPEHVHFAGYKVGGEGADGSWVISTHASDAEARVAEALCSLRYGLPDAAVLRSQDQGGNEPGR